MRESLKEEMEEFSNFVWYLMSYLNIDIPHQQIRNWMFCQVHNKETLFLMSWSPRASLLQGIAPLNGTGRICHDCKKRCSIGQTFCTWRNPKRFGCCPFTKYCLLQGLCTLLSGRTCLYLFCPEVYVKVNCVTFKSSISLMLEILKRREK